MIAKVEQELNSSKLPLHTFTFFSCVVQREKRHLVTFFFLIFRLLLWDCDERRYSYYIEVSNNKSDWETVWDRSKEACQSWQDISFPRRPVVFIRIVGTHNTANEVFHCVHFECPAVTNIVKPSLVDSGENGLTDNKQESSEAGSDENNDLEVAVANAEAGDKQQAR